MVEMTIFITETRAKGDVPFTYTTKAITAKGDTHDVPRKRI